ALVGNDLGRLDALWASASPGESRGGWRQEANVVIAGLVTTMRRRGDSQAFVQLEDGRGRIECAFFSEALQEYAPLLTRDRILIIEGGLREGEFSGGSSRRARRCCDCRHACPGLARGMKRRRDRQEPGPQARVERLLDDHRPGSPPLLHELLLASGACGAVDLNGAAGVRVDADLPGLL